MSKIEDLQFFVRIAGKTVKAQMFASSLGVRAAFETNKYAIMGRDAVKSAYKISKENGDKAEKAWKQCANYCYYNED